MKNQYPEKIGEHKEFIREVPNADSAIVFIHGILSTPLFFEQLITLVPDNFSIYNILLDGHGGGVKDFSATSMKVWKHQTKTLIKYLEGKYENIILVGHSMGTLFSIQSAVARPEKIKALFLLCSPLKVLVHPRSAKYSLRIVFERGDRGDPVENSASRWYSITPDKRLWRYIPWIPKFTSLLSEIRKTRKLAPHITMPAYVFHSRHDSLVSRKAVKFFEGGKNTEIIHLHDSYHQYFTEEDYGIILKKFSEMLSLLEDKEQRIK